MGRLLGVGCSCCGPVAAPPAAAAAGDGCANPSCLACGGPCLGLLGPVALAAPPRRLLPTPALLVRPWVPDPVQP